MTQADSPVAAIVVAAGSGSRLGASVPKAFVPLDGVPLLRRSAEALVEGGAGLLVVVAPSTHLDEAATALAGLGAPCRVVPGGQTRQDSVRLGLDALAQGDDTVVLVHDAARCLVPPSVVRAVGEAIRRGAGAAVPVVPVIDSIREVDGDRSRVVERARLRAVQTPQAARLGALRATHARLADEGIEVTDDASACEHAGLTVELVPGHPDALKITEPLDLVLAEAILRGRS